MKVGIYVPSLQEKLGGGFTFISEVLAGVADLARETDHTFTVFSESPAEIIKNGLLGDSLITVEQVPSFPVDSPKRSLPRRLIARVMREISPPVPVASQIAEVLWHAGTEFMIFMSVHPGGAVLDIPYLIVVWDLQHRTMPWFPEVSSGAEWSVRESIYSSSLRRASIVVTGTRSGAEEIERFYQVPAEIMRILPHPTPKFALADLPPGEGKMLVDLGVTRPYLLYPAQFWPHKNHVNLIEGLLKLKEEFGLIFDLVCVGKDYGNLDHVKECVSKWGLESQVYFPGFVARQDLLQLYKNAFAVTYLSFGGPGEPAPAGSLRIRVSRHRRRYSGAREQLGDAALLVAPTNARQIAEAVNTLFSDREIREQLVSKGKQRTEGRTGRDFAEGLIEILDEFELIRCCWKG